MPGCRHLLDSLPKRATPPDDVCDLCLIAVDLNRPGPRKSAAACRSRNCAFMFSPEKEFACWLLGLLCQLVCNWREPSKRKGATWVAPLTRWLQLATRSSLPVPSQLSLRCAAPR